MSSYTLMIIDDDSGTVDKLNNALNEMSGNFDVKIFQDGNEALQAIVTAPPDLVLMDIQIPGLNGFNLLSELKKQCTWLPVIITTDAHVNGNDKKFIDYGIVDFAKKPYIPEEMVLRIDDVFKRRAKRDVIKNISLPSILQLIEMDKRNGVLTLEIREKCGRIFFSDGKLMDIQVQEMSTREALEAFIDTLYEEREITIEYIQHRKEKKINMSLMQIVMEASRIKDERKVSVSNGDSADNSPEQSPLSGTPRLSRLTQSLDSLKEVKLYLVTDTHGELLATSPDLDDPKDEMLHASIYFWTVGGRIGSEFQFGEPNGLVCYFKSGKRLIRRFNDFIIILDLTGITRYSAFKNKLNELLNQL